MHQNPKWTSMCGMDVGYVWHLMPNKLRKIWNDCPWSEHNSAKLNNKTIELMDNLEGFNKIGAQIGLDFQPYVVWKLHD